ncbi:MAG: PHP domain-containing protein [Armatimonadetes bacterium]|nr:PHP domain-containing protein [Armatimonadota bacterium]
MRITDYHCHTEYAYCAQDVNAAGAIAQARASGLHRLCLTEHSGQLYLNESDYWGAAYLLDPGLCARERAAGRSRMPHYRAAMSAYRAEDVLFGLEVECDGAGGITLLEEDRAGWDVLLGAVHNLPELFSARPDSAAVEREFLEATERLFANGVNILAHPFRVFRRLKMPVPERLFGPVAELLAAFAVAAELNFHGNSPEPEFFALCLKKGIPIALGSDSHQMCEVGDFRAHVDFLKSIGAPEDPDSILYHIKG